MTRPKEQSTEILRARISRDAEVSARRSEISAVSYRLHFGADNWTEITVHDCIALLLASRTLPTTTTK